MSYDINTIGELVDVLGGDTAVAEKLGISQPAVGNWKMRGTIGAGWHLRLFAECVRLNKTVSPRVFGLDEEEVPVLFRGGPFPVHAVTSA